MVYFNRNNDIERYKARKYYLPKSTIKNYNVIINERNFYDQLIDFGIKQYEVRKLATGLGEDCTKGSLLDDDYIKNSHRLTAVDLRRQKGLDADPKAIQQIKFVWHLKNIDNVNADGTQSMFVLTILQKNQRNKTKIFSREQSSLTKDGKL